MQLLLKLLQLKNHYLQELIRKTIEGIIVLCRTGRIVYLHACVAGALMAVKYPVMVLIVFDQQAKSILKYESIMGIYIDLDN